MIEKNSLDFFFSFEKSCRLAGFIPLYQAFSFLQVKSFSIDINF